MIRSHIPGNTRKRSREEKICCLKTGGLSNKVATNRSYYSNLRYINILQRQISALLRRWLWVRAPPNPRLHTVSSCDLKGHTGLHDVTFQRMFSLQNGRSNRNQS